MKPHKRTSKDLIFTPFSPKDDKSLYDSLMVQCINVFVEAQSVWKYYSRGYKSPYDKDRGNQLQYEIMPSRWIIESVEPHNPLMHKTLERIYKGASDWQTEKDRGLLLFEWYGKSLLRYEDKSKFKIGDFKKIKVAVNEARFYIFGRKPNTEQKLTDEEILACFAMHEVLDAKIMFQGARAEGCISTLGKGKLNKAKVFLELVKSSRESEKKIEDFAEYPSTQQLRDYERWFINKDKLEVYYDYENTKYPIKFTDLQFSVFCCLYEKIGSYVKIKTLEKCWKDKKPDYVDYVKDCVSKIKNKIKQELNKNRVKNYGNIIEPDNPKNTKAYKLVA
ncbi:MAG: hypothetical protein ACE5GU_12685 [Candidatus Scalinduaceae bacterium]